jgi:phosphonate transport system substrate-binding protein
MRFDVSYLPFRPVVLAFVCVATCSQSVAQTQVPQEQKIVFGVVPQQAASHLAHIWIPLLNALSEQTGLQLEFATAKDIPTFEACLAAAKYDIAYMNPYHYVVYHKTAGYRAFAKEKGARLKGLIVTKADGSFNNISDLSGQKVAFPSPAALAASVIPRAEIRRQSVIIEPLYVKSHDSVYRAVASGLVPAGGGIMRTFNTLPEDIKSKLKIIFETKDYTPHAFAASPQVPADIIEKITSHMHTFQTATLLEPLSIRGFERAHDTDWNDVRALNLSQQETGLATQDMTVREVPCRFD